MPARSGRGRCHQLSATHRTGGDVQSRSSSNRVYAMTAHEARVTRDPPGAYASGGRRARSALGARGGDVRRRSISRHATGRCRGARLPGRRDVRRRDAGDRDAQALRRTRTAGRREQLRAGQRLACGCCAKRFSPPFKACIREAGRDQPDGLVQRNRRCPVACERWLLRDVLRKEWGFEGFIVSDYYAIWELSDRPDTHGHHVAADKREACALAVRAGVNIELPEPDCYLHLTELVRSTVTLREARSRRPHRADAVLEVPHGAVRRSVRRSRTRPRQWLPATDIVRSPSQAARETITLLKNEGGILPLDPARQSTLAVIGPNADRLLLGGYSGVPAHNTTVLRGSRGGRSRYRSALRRRVPHNDWRLVEQDAVTPSRSRRGSSPDRRGGRGRARADVIVLAIGGNEQTSREAWSLVHLGDRTSLDMVGRQEELARAMHRDRQAGGCVPLQRASAVDSVSRRAVPQRFSSAGISDRSAGERWPRCCSAR